MQNSDEKLKKALAQELPLLINPKFMAYHERFDDRLITSISSREWSWIMSEVEKKLSASGPIDFKGCRYSSQASLFVCLLAALVSGVELGEWQMPAFGMGCELVFKIATAPWQTRAVAYFAAIGKTIK